MAPQKSMMETLRKDCLQMGLSELNKNGEASGKAILEGCGGHQETAGAVSKGLSGVCVCVCTCVRTGGVTYKSPLIVRGLINSANIFLVSCRKGLKSGVYSL